MAGNVATGLYPALVTATSAGAKTEIKALVTTLRNLIDGQSSPGGVAMDSPEFDRIMPSTSQQLMAELDAISLAITNGA